MKQEDLVAYIDGELTAADESAFEADLRESPELVDELTGLCRQRLLLEEHFADVSSVRNKNVIHVVRSEMAAKRHVARPFVAPEPNVGWRVLMTLAASLVAIVGGYWLLNHGGRTQADIPPVSVLATVQTVAGKVEMTRGVQRFPVTAGMQIRDGDTLVVSGEGRAEIRYAEEQTSVALSTGATVKLWLQDNAKRIGLDAGTLACEIAKQPEGRPMRFITPQAQAVVLGTRLKLAVANDATRLEVTDGSVKLVRNDQVSVTVNAGEFAVAADRVELKSQLLTLVSPTAPLTGGVLDYYARWSNGIPDDPDFFPIWVWDQLAVDARSYRDAGMNIYVTPYGFDAKDLAKLAAADMKIICGQDRKSLPNVGNRTIIGWLNYDQPDVTQVLTDLYRVAMSPAGTIKQYNRIKSADASRPVYMAFSEGVVRDDYPKRGTRMNHPEDYREFVKAADILGFHVMPINEPQAPVGGNPWYVAKATDNLREYTANIKPVWAGIECTRVRTDSAAMPTPAQVKAEVWISLVHGARGIGYLTYSRFPNFDRTALLRDRPMLAEITGIDRQIASLAPVLNAPTVTDGTTVASSDTSVPIDAMVKKYAGAAYLFAVAMRDGETTATFTVPACDKAEVLGENRRIDIRGGKFSDHFGAYGVHLYKLTASPETAKQ